MTLDADVEQQLREAMRRQGTGFKQTLNDALRRGLGPDGSSALAESFEIEAKPMGMRTGLDPARIRDLDDDLEIEEFLRKTARLKHNR